MKRLRLAYFGFAATFFLWLNSCAPTGTVGSITSTKFADGKYEYLERPVPFDAPRTQLHGVIPRGFVTDGPSIPMAARSIIPKDGRYAQAAVVHDYLYWEQPCSQEVADNVMFELMEANEVPWGERNSIYETLRLTGHKAWEKNRRDRNSGLPRYVPERWIGRIPPSTDWSVFENYLTSRSADIGVHGPSAAD
jgi:hypothetical protein